MIPEARLPQSVLQADIDFCLKKVHDESVKVEVHLNNKTNVEELASQYDHVILASGQSVNRFPAEYEAVKKYILQPQQILDKKENYADKKVIVIGGGAVAVDVCSVLHE